VSRLRIFPEDRPDEPEVVSEDGAEISRRLGEAGVRFERWTATRDVAPGAPLEDVIAAYAPEVERLKAEQGYTTVDVISMRPDHPERDALREKFRSEHTHSEDEVRFFVAGEGLFTLHIGPKVYEVLCRRDDLISVPQGTPHWFDMGPEPSFVAIRLFVDPAGWVASYTGSDIAARFGSLEDARA